MPALSACCLRRAFVLPVHVAQREELIGGRPRHRVHEEREVARLRQSSLAAVARVHRQERADDVVVRCLQEGAHMLECPGSSSSEEPASLAADPAEDSTSAAARDTISSRLERSDADGKAERGLVRRRLVTTSRGAAATKKELGRYARNGPLERHGPDSARKTSPGILSGRASAWSLAGNPANPTTRRAGPAVSQESEHQISC